MTPSADGARPNCALRYQPDGFRVDRKAVMGRQSAGAGFLKGFIEHGGADRLIALTDSRAHFDDFRALSGQLDRAGREVVWAHPLDRQTLRSAGTVFWPAPGFDEQAWNRRFGSERDYSLCGVAHTVASATIVGALGQYLLAPTQPWDALVCPSTAVRTAIERIIEQHADHLARRGGGHFRSPVRLAVIPLGVDCESYAPRDDDAVPGAGPGARHALRARLGIAEGDLAALFVGRLAFHAKAHPTPLLLAAARAALRVQGRTIHLLLAGQFPNRAAEREFREAAGRFGGAARVHFIDGSDGPHGPVMRSVWRAADIFVSLSDNIQETFGLTPVEAMAAGLPCVVSDWNGYKDTVADGETGFRIPTTTIGAGAGIDIADRHAAGVDSYDQMLGITSLATAVDVDACAEAIARLASDAALRGRLGKAASARARRLYDWRVVVAAYQDLWSELAELRAASPGLALRRRREAARTDVPDPFAVYRHYPTALLDAGTVVAAKSPDAAADLARLRQGELNLHPSVAYAFLSDAEVDALLSRLASAPARPADLAADHPGAGRRLLRTLLWLRKFNLVEFQAATERPANRSLS